MTAQRINNWSSHAPAVAAHRSSDYVLSEVARIAKARLAPIVNDIDQKGFYPGEAMRALGEAGAFAQHLHCYGADYRTALRTTTIIGEQCGSTGFITWCQNVCGLYLEESDNPALLDRLSTHARGESLGGTALSNPIKAMTGIEKMALRAAPVAGGYLISGVLPWVSHIARGHYCGAIAAVEDSRSDHEIMFLLDIDDNVVLQKCPKFSAMEGTSTWAIKLDRYFVDHDKLIADPVRPFLQRVRPAFVLLQTGMATGVIRAAIGACEAVEDQLGHVNQFLENRPDQLRDELTALEERLASLADAPVGRDSEYLIDVLDARIRCSELSLRATQSGLLHQGARF